MPAVSLLARLASTYKHMIGFLTALSVDEKLAVEAAIKAN
jgi:hypothetical protein